MATSWRTIRFENSYNELSVAESGIGVVIELGKRGERGAVMILDHENVSELSRWLMSIYPQIEGGNGDTVEDS